MPSPNSTNFLIISAQRSGSTLIRTMLDSHPAISCYGEVFLPTYRKQYSFYNYLSQAGHSKVVSVILRSPLVTTFLDQLYSAKQSVAIGFKIMYDQASYRPYKFPMVLTYARKNGIKVIHLVRENSFRVCLSRQFARASKTYHISETQNQSALTIDIPLLLSEIKLLEQKKSWCRSKLKRLDSIEVCYETFIANKPNESVRILNFIGVDESLELHSPLQKVLTAPINEAVINYTELSLAIKNAGYGKFLE